VRHASSSGSRIGRNGPRAPGRVAACTAIRRWWSPALTVALLLAGAAGSAPAAALLEPKLVIWGYADGSTFHDPRGVAFDPLDGAIYVANTGAHRIEVFSRTGRPLTWFVHRVTAPDRATVDGQPCALAFDRAGHLLVVDNAAAYVDVLDRRGRPLRRLDLAGGRPAAVAVGPGGAIYAATSGEGSRIHRFGADYAPAGSWGEPGTGPGRLHSVTALGVLADSTLAVACGRTDLGIQIFTPDGAYLRGFGTHEMGPGNVSLPSGILGTPDGRIWVCDEIRQSVQVFDSQGAYLELAGGRGAAPGEFAYPSAIASDGKGLVAVTDRELGRVQVLALPPGSAGGPGR
jgi:DNA-binding beta-propeller fold protein YncE